MNRYRYQATYATGESVSAEVDAPSVNDALVELEKQGLTILSIEVVSPEKIAADAELAVFYKELDQLLEHRADWLPPLQALTTELPRGSVRRHLEKQLFGISRIATPQEFIEHPDAIALLPMIAPRFQSIRILPSKPDWLIQSAQRFESLSRYLNAFIYPIFLLGVSIIAYILLSIFVFPIFGSIFTELRVRPPKSTEWMLWSSKQFTDRAAITFVLCLLSGVVIFVLIRWWRNRALTNWIFGRLISGRTSNLLAISRLITTLAELLELKAPLGLALSIAGKSCNHAYYQHATDCLAENARSGILSEIHPQAKMRLPPLLLDALQRDETNGSRLPLLRELALLYGDRARNRPDWMIAGGPNLALFFVGLFILGIVVTLFSAIGQLISNLSQ